MLCSKLQSGLLDIAEVSVDSIAHLFSQSSANRTSFQHLAIMSGIDGPPLKSKAVTIPQPPYPVDGNGTFSNLQLAAVVIFSPWLFFKFIPFFSISLFSWAYLLFWLPITGVPAAIGYWYLMSRVGGVKRDFAAKTLPNKPMDYYFTFKDQKLKQQYANKKIPMQTLYDAYFDQKVDFNREVADFSRLSYLTSSTCR